METARNDIAFMVSCNRSMKVQTGLELFFQVKFTFYFYERNLFIKEKF